MPLVPAARGTADAARTFDVPAGAAAITLPLFIAQARVNVIYADGDVADVRTQAVNGDWPPLSALQAMLAGSGLRAIYNQKRTALAITRSTRSGTAIADPLPPMTPSFQPSSSTPNPNPRMTTPRRIHGLLLLLGGLTSAAQTVPPLAQDAITLTPFEVVGSTGDAYGTTATNSATMFRTEVEKLPVTADVMTSQFIRDLDIQDMDQLISTFATGSGWGSVQSDTDAMPRVPGVRSANTEIKLRGVGGGVVRRDGLISANNGTFNDTFATESIEILKGPNALLYAGAAGGGVISAVSKQARFGPSFTLFSLRLDSYGSQRGELDLARTHRTGWKLLPEVAVRAALMKQHQKLYRDGYGNEAEGAYVQLALRLPKSTLRVGYMHSEALHYAGWIPSFVYRSNRPATGAWDPAPEIVARHTGPNGAIPTLSYANLFDEGEGARIANGRLTRRNLNGAFMSDYNHNPKEDYVIANLETRWSRHLSSLITFADSRNPVDMQYTFAGNLYAPGYVNIERANPVPYNPSTPIGSYAPTILDTTRDWTMVTPADEYYMQDFRRRAFRAALGAEWSNWGGRLKHNAVVGYEWTELKTNFDWQFYYLADKDWNIIVNPDTVATTSTNGRIQLRNLWYEVGSRPATFARPNPLRQKRITVNGQNWVLQSKNYVGMWPRTPENPQGLRPANAPGGSFDGNSYVNSTTDAFFGALQTDWFDDRFVSVLSLRHDEYVSSRWDFRTLGGTGREEKSTSGNVGVNWRAGASLRPYANYSRAVAFPGANITYGPFGDPVPVEKSTGYEVGTKFKLFGRVDGSLSYFDTEVLGKNTSSNDAFNVNPSGLNGQAQPAERWIGVDQRSNGVELMLSGSPRPGWRTSLRGSWQDGRVGNTLEFPLVYNDEFHTNAAGEVTYRNGAVLQVNPNSVAAVASGGVPLTVAMMNDPASIYYWDPNPRNGTTQNGALRTVLVNAVASLVSANGPVTTGRTGLPSSARQIAWDDPLNVSESTVITRQGRKTIGYASVKFSFTNTYTFQSQLLRNFSVGGVLNVELENRNRWIRWPIQFDSRNRIVVNTDDVRGSEMPRVNTDGRFYYTDQGLLWGLPDNYYVNAWVTYTKRFGRDGRYKLTSQVNVNNVFDRVKLVSSPTSGSSIYGETRGFTQQNDPRSWSWTNRIEF